MLTIKHKKVNPLQFVSLKKNVEGAKYKINIKFDLRECDNVFKDDSSHSSYMIKLIPLTDELLKKSYISKNEIETFINSQHSRYRVDQYSNSVDYLELYDVGRFPLKFSTTYKSHTIYYNINMVNTVNKKLKEYLKSNETISKINNAKITNDAIGLGYIISAPCLNNIKIYHDYDDYLCTKINPQNACNISITTSNRNIENTVENIISIIQEELHKVFPNIKVTCGDIVEESVYSFYEDNKEIYYKFLEYIEDSNIKIVERFDTGNNTSYLYNIIAKTKNRRTIDEIVPEKTFISLSKTFENCIATRYINFYRQSITTNSRCIIDDYNDFNSSRCGNLILQTNDIKQIKKAKLMLSNELDITCYTPCVVIVKDLENIKTILGE